MNIFSEMIHSVYDTRCYGQFLRDKKSKTFLFGFLLVMFYFAVTILVPFARFQLSTGGIMNMFDQMVPDFTINDRQVRVAYPVEYELGGTYIFADTDCVLDDSQISSYVRKYNTVLIMDSDRLVIKNSGRIQEVLYEELDPKLNATKSGVMESLSPVVTLIMVIVLVFLFVGMELMFFFGVLIVALLGMIAASCMQYRLTFGQLYKLGIYTRTTPMLIKAALSFLPVIVPFFTVMSMGISVAYLAAGIRNMKTPPLSGGPLVFSSGQTGPVQKDV